MNTTLYLNINGVRFMDNKNKQKDCAKIGKFDSGYF